MSEYIGAVHHEAAESFRARFEQYVGDGPDSIPPVIFDDLVAVCGWLTVYGGSERKVARAMQRSRDWVRPRIKWIRSLVQLIEV